jgi:GxxExxY protein
MLEKEPAYSLLHMTENDIARHVFDSAQQIHKDLGPGLLEEAYREFLVHKLRKKGFAVESNKIMSLVYDEIALEKAYAIGIHVENKLIIEVKAVDALKEVHQAQLLTYLKLTGNKLGLLINFNTSSLKDSFRRIINGYL